VTRPVVLYVEDEPDDVFFLRAAVKAVGADADVRDVGDGAAAMAYLSGEGPYADRAAHPLPSLVLLDVNLPLLSGFEVLRWIRGQPALRGLPVVVFSSSGRPEDRALAKELDAQDYVQKPPSGRQFRDVVRGLQARWLKC
jgi:CheY-like chemotaxis protein